jgi:hypothetical protein
MAKPLKCPGCPGNITRNDDASWSHSGLHSADCIIKQYEPLSSRAVIDYTRGKWRVNPAVEGGIEAIVSPPPPPRPPVSEVQMGQVIKVNFKKKKRI